jgi:uncharacterized hydantoinase/oxoprolinase family protein
VSGSEQDIKENSSRKMSAFVQIIHRKIISTVKHSCFEIFERFNLDSVFTRGPGQRLATGWRAERSRFESQL